MKTFISKEFTHKHQDTQTLVAATCESAPSVFGEWVESDESIIFKMKLVKLWRAGNVQFWGYM